MYNLIDKIYDYMLSVFKKIIVRTIPYIRRFFRFLALPYAYIFLVNWKECTRNKFIVAYDFLYIFFVLKDYPDYYSVLRWWEVERSEWKYYYGSFYNPYQRRQLRKNVQPKEFEVLFTDKFLCHQLTASLGLAQPQVFKYVEPNGCFRENIKKVMKSNDQVIMKSTTGRGGHEIYLIKKNGDDITISNPNEKWALDEFELRSPSILQKVIQQHPDISVFSDSLNTIRTETILTPEKEVLIIGAFMRFGIDGSFIDNQSSGGLSVGIDIKKGVLKSYALNAKGEKFYAHPESQIVFNGFKIPFWNEVLELSKNIQLNFPYYKILGPDIAVKPDGPVIVEINATPDHGGLEMDYGPTLKDKKIRDAFKKYDLLINSRIKSVD